MKATIKVQSHKTEIQDLLSQICVTAPDCEKFEMNMIDPMKSLLPQWEMKLIIIADRELLEEILEIVNTAEVEHVQTIISSNLDSKTQVEFEPFGMP